MKQVAVLLKDGFEDIEALTPIDFLRRAGVEVILCGNKTVTSSRGVSFGTDMSQKDYFALCEKKGLPDAVITPGGLKGSKSLASDSEVGKFLTKMWKNGKFVCGICAAPIIVLSPLGFLMGKNFTCYQDMENDFPEFAGSNWEEKTAGSKHSTEPVVVDGNLITSRGAGTSLDFALKIIECLLGKDKAVEIAHSVMMEYK